MQSSSLSNRAPTHGVSHCAAIAHTLNASLRKGAAVGISVGTGLAAKAGYMALTRALPASAQRPVSYALLGAGTLPAGAGAAVLADGVKQMLVGGPPLAGRRAVSVCALGTLAFLAGMLASAWVAFDDPATEVLGEHMLANAAGQVLAMGVSEALASRLIPAVLVPRSLLVDGQPLVPGSAREAQVEQAGARAMFLAQVMAHAPLIWRVMGQVPAIEQAFGVSEPAGIRPGRSGPLDYLRAGLALACAVGSVEFGRVTAGSVGQAAGQAWAGARSVRVEDEPAPEAQADEVQADEAQRESPPEAQDLDARTLSCLQRCKRQLHRIASRLGLNEAAQARTFAYAPLLNLTAGAMVTGPGSGFIRALSAWWGRPVIDTALAVSGLTNGMLNLVDLPLAYRRPVAQAQVAASALPAPSTGRLSRGSDDSSSVEISELRASDFLAPDLWRRGSASELRASDFETRVVSSPGYGATGASPRPVNR